MGLIADVVQSFASSLLGAATGFRWQKEDFADDLLGLADAFKSSVDTFAEENPTVIAVLGLSSPAALAVFSAAGLGNPQTFSKELFDKWNLWLTAAFGALNVEVSGQVVGPDVGAVEDLAGKLAAGTQQSQIRVTAAITVINLILVSGSAVSVAAEIASLGAVRSIAEAIQSWIWANGLGSFSPLAFQPQVNASIQPYLQRHYNSRARAQIPPVTDIIRFQLREVYLAGRREELVGTEDRPVFDALMAEWGFDKFHSDSYWGAHWQLPSQGQLNEMLWRGVIDRETWERFTRFNDLEPSSIPRVAEIIYSPYTRVDVRRMARLGILSDQEVLQAYADIGFFAPTVTDDQGKQRAVFVGDPDFTVHRAQALVVFTKLFNAVPELRQRFSKGWISGPDVLQGLLETGLPALRAQIIFETIVKSEGPARTAPERELSRSLIARAWKLREISFTQAIFLLERIGWDNAEAELILRVQSQPDDPLAFVPTNLGARLGAPVFGQIAEIPEI